MQALLCSSLGRLDDLRIGEAPVPKLQARDVLVRVSFCGLNFPDVLMVEGKYQRKPPLPFSPGCEFSGTVEALGTDVSEWTVGDRVCGTVGYGALAEKLAVSADELFAVPTSVSMQEAAALLYTYATSLYALRDRATLAAGESLLVLGAGGGVGIAAVELGKALGARVVAAASSDAKLILARAKGADQTLCYSADMREKEQQKIFSQQLKELAGEGAFNVICDPVGGGYSEPAFRSIAWGGRHLIIGFAAGSIPSIAMNLPLLKGAQIVGVVWGNAFMRNPSLKSEIHHELLKMLDLGKIRPHIAETFEFRDCKEALKALAERRAVGKVIVRCG